MNVKDYKFKWTPYDDMTNEELKARTEAYRQAILKIFRKALDKKE
jgi:hypothetical protein